MASLMGRPPEGWIDTFDDPNHPPGEAWSSAEPGVAAGWPDPAPAGHAHAIRCTSGEQTQVFSTDIDGVVYRTAGAITIREGDTVEVSHDPRLRGGEPVVLQVRRGPDTHTFPMHPVEESNDTP